jgi:WD40 repeat protein
MTVGAKASGHAALLIVFAAPSRPSLPTPTAPLALLSLFRLVPSFLSSRVVASRSPDLL